METSVKANTILYFSWGEVIGKEKIMLGSGQGSKHICVTNVGHRKAINLHFTRDNRKGRANYLIELSHFQIGRLVVELQEKLKQFIIENSIFQIIDTNKANSDSIVFIPQDDIKKSSLDFLKVEKKRFKIRDNIENQNFENLFISANEFNQNNSNFYFVYKVENNSLIFLGGISRIENENKRHFVRYINKEKSELLSTFFEKCIFQILLKHEFRYKETLLRYLRFTKYNHLVS